MADTYNYDRPRRVPLLGGERVPLRSRPVRGEDTSLDCLGHRPVVLTAADFHIMKEYDAKWAAHWLAQHVRSYIGTPRTWVVQFTYLGNGNFACAVSFGADTQPRTMLLEKFLDKPIDLGTFVSQLMALAP